MRFIIGYYFGLGLTICYNLNKNIRNPRIKKETLKILVLIHYLKKYEPAVF